MNGIIVGGMQVSPDSLFPAPVISVDYSDQQEAQEAAKLLSLLQNGVCPLKVGQLRPVFMGDTNIQVVFSRERGSDHALVEVYAKSNPRHITCGFYEACKVSLENVRAFRKLFDLNRSYTVTVSCNGRVLTDDLDVVKYSFRERGVPS